MAKKWDDTLSTALQKLAAAVGDATTLEITTTFVQPGEVFQVVDHVPIIGIQPELVEAVGRRALGIQPDAGTGRRFAELAAIGLGNQRVDQRQRLLATHLADQLNAGDDIPPLITAARLHRAVVVVV